VIDNVCGGAAPTAGSMNTDARPSATTERRMFRFRARRKIPCVSCTPFGPRCQGLRPGTRLKVGIGRRVALAC
jgi:hypothetical protein